MLAGNKTKMDDKYLQKLWETNKNIIIVVITYCDNFILQKDNVKEKQITM